MLYNETSVWKYMVYIFFNEAYYFNNVRELKSEVLG
jgi:hypothetical protein